MKKFSKNKKALSPVIAAIILIAVTVAVSIAVGAWMGSTTTGFMGTDELTIKSVVFNAEEGQIILNVTNAGSQGFTVHAIKINGELTSSWSSETSNTIPPSADETFTITHAVTPGAKYNIALLTYDGTMIGAHVGTA